MNPLNLEFHCHQVREKMRLDGAPYLLLRMADFETFPDIPHSGECRITVDG